MAIARRIAPSAPRVWVVVVGWWVWGGWVGELLVERTEQFVEQATGPRVKSTPIYVNRVPI